MDGKAVKVYRGIGSHFISCIRNVDTVFMFVFVQSAFVIVGMSWK